MKQTIATLQGSLAVETIENSIIFTVGQDSSILSMDSLRSIYRVLNRKSSAFLLWVEGRDFRFVWQHYENLRISSLHHVAILSDDAAMLLKEIVWEVLNEHFNN